MNYNEIDKNDIIEPLQGSIDYLNKVLLYKNSISNKLNQENYNNAWEKFEEMIDGLVKLNQLLINIQNILSIDYKEVYHENKTIAERINKFNNFLNEIISGMENKDYLEVADLIEFEFDEYLRSYKKVFINLLNLMDEK
jgi:hypothetical protein